MPLSLPKGTPSAGAPVPAPNSAGSYARVAATSASDGARPWRRRPGSQNRRRPAIRSSGGGAAPARRAAAAGRWTCQASCCRMASAGCVRTSSWAIRRVTP